MTLSVARDPLSHYAYRRFIYTRARARELKEKLIFLSIPLFPSIGGGGGGGGGP